MASEAVQIEQEPESGFEKLIDYRIQSEDCDSGDLLRYRAM